MKHVLLGSLLAAAAVAGGCVSTSPEWEGTFGDATRQARAAQVINPNAPTQNTGIGNTDGNAVAGAQKAYSESYGYGVKEPKAQTLVVPTTGSR